MSNTKSQFSEFTYGFALTHELITGPAGKFLHAPRFPSLREEGKVGYDVSIPGKCLFIQFKLSEPLLTRRAKEVRDLSFSIPCFRMHFWPRDKSDQHKHLLTLEQTNAGSVFYAAPAFWQLDELDQFFHLKQIEENSRLVPPSKLPIPIDSNSHHLSFDSASGTKTGMYSDKPEPLELTQPPLMEILAIQLIECGNTPLGENLARIGNWFLQSGLLTRDEVMRLGQKADVDGDLWVPRIDQIAAWAAIHLNSSLFILQEQVS